jgi:3-oxoacyl-[acyl-carrier-protein] synthase-1
MEAIEDSGLEKSDLNSDRVGCIVGSGISNTDPIFRAGYSLKAQGAKTTPYDITRCMCNSCSANLVNFYRLKGRSYSLSSACATSLHNIGHGMELINSGICDIVLAGGSEEVTSILTYMFDSMRTVLSKSFNECPEKASRPYDIKRDGFVVSGGGGIVVLEDFQRAKQRNAPIYGEIIGYGANSDGHDIIQPHPQGEGAINCIKEALKVANCPKEEIDYINAHATGTPTGDVAEAIAIKKVFGSHEVPVSSTKSISGHGIGAAGVQELIYCLLMMKHGFISGSKNIEELDPACNILNIITDNRSCSLNKILTVSLGFGGTNASLIVKRI